MLLDKFIETDAEEQLLQCAKLGDWLLLQQAHLRPAWLAALPGLLESLRAGGGIHPRFTLWLACDDGHAANPEALGGDADADGIADAVAVAAAVPPHLLLSCVQVRLAAHEPPRPLLPAEIEAELRAQHRSVL